MAGTANVEDEENGFSGTVTALGFTQSIAELSRRVDEAMRWRLLVKR